MLSETYSNIPKLFMKEEYDVAPIASKILELDDFLMTEICVIQSNICDQLSSLPHTLIFRLQK